MTVLFVHDHRLHLYQNEYYSNGSFSSEAIQRYTKVFKKVTFVSRQINVMERPNGMSLANTEGTTFRKIPDFKSIATYHKKKEAIQIIRREVSKSDYIIARLPSEAGYIAINYAKKYRKPYLIEVVTCPWDSLWNHSMLGKTLAPTGYFKLKKVVKHAPYVVYVTREFLQNRYPTKGKNVNCSNVALTEFNEEVLKKRVSKIKKHSEKIVIGTTAAVDVKFKGQKYIIEALSELKKEGYTNFEYELVGGGSQDYLKNIVKKYNVESQVKFIGNIPHNEVFDWLQTIDIYVQPSRQEGLPRALIEAMSKGVPAFGANTAGIPELLHEEYIFSNSKKNIKEIKEIILNYNKKTMVEQAERNYKESQKYKKNIVEERRNIFFREFKNENKKTN